MQYPIFNTFINRIKSDLTKKNIVPEEFSIWQDDTINATGLELKIDLSKVSPFMRDITINFDWDMFREISMAKQLPDMKKHPLLSVKKSMSKASLAPSMDVEVTWNMQEDAIIRGRSLNGNNWRLDLASSWMEQINQHINETMPADFIITRWHIEIDGDTKGRYLSAMSLISYFQFTLTQQDSLNDILEFISKKLQLILVRSNRIIQIAEGAAKTVAA
jgi:hypothetical protein